MGENRRNKKKSHRIAVLTIIAFIVIVAGAGMELFRTFGHNNTYTILKEYLGIFEETQWALLLNDDGTYNKALEKDGSIYVPFDFVVSNVDERYYYDSELNAVLYALPTELVKANYGEASYYRGEEQAALPSAGLIKVNDSYYISTELMEALGSCIYDINQENKIVWLWDKFDEDIPMAQVVKGDRKLRTSASIRSQIVADLFEGEKVYVIGDEGEFVHCITENGMLGYTQSENLTSCEPDVKKSKIEPAEYTSIVFPEKSVMGWHQMDEYNYTNQTERLAELVSGTNLNVVSPTWYSLASSDGGLTSFASADYVAKAHEMGLSVWALVDNFNSEVDNYQFLSSFSARQKLIGRLIEDARALAFDGINIDFEASASGLGGLDSSCGIHFTEFLRELSIQCRNNGVILSVDNYVPTSYNQYYNLYEQGQVVDYVVIMAYDEHYAGSSEIGSVSSYNFVDNAVTGALKKADADKIILAVPFYTRIWALNDSGVILSSEAKGASALKKQLDELSVETSYKETEHQNYAEYIHDNIHYKVWLEDEESMSWRLNFVKVNNLAGVSAWKLGLEPDSFWDIFKAEFGE